MCKNKCKSKCFLKQSRVERLMRHDLISLATMAEDILKPEDVELIKQMMARLLTK